MRKIKKINGFLVVKFNDREKREYEGTALGEYGVIDAEVYTGNLDIDRGAMEYDDADTGTRAKGGCCVLYVFVIRGSRSAGRRSPSRRSSSCTAG